MKACARRFCNRLIIEMGIVLGVCTSLSSPSEAKDLTKVLSQGMSVNALNFNPNVAGAIAPGIAAGISQAVTQEFPQAAVSPAFTFRYNPTLSVFERTTAVPGPLFSERATTLGRGQLNFSVGYSFIEFQDLNGTDLDALVNPVLIPTTVGTPQPTTIVAPNGRTALYFPAALSTDVIRMDLKAHVITPTLRYGVTDRWDVGVVIPIVRTSLKVRTTAVYQVETPANFADPTFGGGFLFQQDASGNPIVSPATTAYLNPDRTLSTNPYGLRFARTQRASTTLARASGNSTGVGDITLRSKYHFWGDDQGGATWGLNLLLPSGDEDDFQGTGETHVATFLYLSQVLQERFEPHLNVGVDFNADDVDRSSFLYAVGASVLVWNNMALIVDFLGRNEFGRLALSKPPNSVISQYPLNRASRSCTPQTPCQLDTTKQQVSSFFFPETFKRNDIADFSFGVRWALGAAGSAFFGGIVPLNDDGFRADFIPSAGLEYTF
jgi:outer membrane putative beta-barrel porin/alpha-amylase